jgi:hypothetical protein
VASGVACAGAVAAEPAPAAAVPTMAAGVYTAPADVARCQAVWEAYAEGKSIRVLPPAKTIKLRDKPATFAVWTRRGSELKGMVSSKEAPSCMLPFLASQPFPKTPIFDRLTGLTWLGERQYKAIAPQQISEAIQGINAREAGGFSDWRAPTLPEIASVMDRQVDNSHWPTVIWKDQWSADRGPRCQWGMGQTADWDWCERGRTVPIQPVRAAVPSADPAPRVTAGLVASKAELAACQRAEWLRFVEGRDVPVTSRERPVKLRAAPAELSAKDLADRLGALYLHDDGQRCFVNEYHGKDGTVVDAATGLEWEVGASPKIMKWRDAEAYVKDLDARRYLGYGDWRLPTVEEAATLIESVDFHFPPTELDPSVFGTSSFVWTCDLDPGRKNAWLLDTGSGRFETAPIQPGVSVNDENRVKVVRSINR